MKRHPALRDLSRDHMFALRVAHHIDQAVRQITNGPSIEEAAGELIATWPEDLSHHLREEEDVFLPLISRHLKPTDVPKVRRILDDHAWSRDVIPKLIATATADLDAASEAFRLRWRSADRVGPFRARG